MAGKRQRKDLRGVDRNSPEYWEEILGREGLSNAKGTSNHLVYIGDGTVLEWIAGKIETNDGRVPPKPQSP